MLLRTTGSARASAAEELASQGQQLKGMIARFKLKDTRDRDMRYLTDSRNYGAQTQQFTKLAGARPSASQPGARAGAQAKPAVRKVAPKTSKKETGIKPVDPSEVINLDDDLFMVDDEDDEDTLANKYILFLLGEETYGINIAYVTDIIELQKITEVPDMPNYVKGVINLRGKVIPVLDLRIRFGMGEKDYDDRTCVIIVKLQTISVGFIVDIVSEVHLIPEKSIDPPPAFKGGSGEKKEHYIKGLGKVGSEVKILIDVEKLVNEEELDKAADLAS